MIHYQFWRSASVRVGYELTKPNPDLRLGSARRRFKRQGIFRLGKKVSKKKMARIRAARSFQVRFQVSKAPSNCSRFYKKRVSIEKTVSGQTVWFQSDSKFAPYLFD